MVSIARKRKKVVKYRGSKTHGGGSMKKRRGAGHRGGRGRAGSGKRGDAKKPRYWRDQEKKGFSSKRAWTPTTLNVGHLSSMIESLAASGVASGKVGGDAFTIDLATLKIDRLLGGGLVTKKLTVKVGSASTKAVEKITAAGGNVEQLSGDESGDAKASTPAEDADDASADE